VGRGGEKEGGVVDELSGRLRYVLEERERDDERGVIPGVGNRFFPIVLRKGWGEG